MLNHSAIDDGSTLQSSPALSRVHRHLRDLLTVAFEASNNTPSTCLYLTRCEYAYDVKHDGKFSMHLNVLVREQGRSEGTPISLTITAEV